MSMTAARGIPKFEAGPQKSAVARGQHLRCSLALGKRARARRLPTLQQAVIESTLSPIVWQDTGGDKGRECRLTG